MLFRSLKKMAKKYVCRKLSQYSIYFAREMCVLDVPKDFIESSIMMPHVFGITLSPSFMGCDCQIRQNTTIGASASEMTYNCSTEMYRPRLGHLVTTFPGAVISGKIRIGHCSIIAANSIVTKDVPSFSICYGVNKFKQIDIKHYNILISTLYHCCEVYKLNTLCVVSGKTTIDSVYSDIRKQAIQIIDSPQMCVDFLKSNIFRTEYSALSGINS